MNKLQLTIIFDAPFYKAIFEKTNGKSYSVASINLGTSEPKTRDIYYLILNNWKEIQFFKEKNIIKKKSDHINIKKIQKKIRQDKKKTLKFNGTKAQQALQKQHESIKKKKKKKKKIDNEKQKETKFMLRQQKKKQKHKGH